MKKYMTILIPMVSFICISGLDVVVTVTTSGNVPNCGHVFTWMTGGNNTHHSQPFHGEDTYTYNNISGINYYDTVEAETIIPSCNNDHNVVPLNLPTTNIHLNVNTHYVPDNTIPMIY
ncbi:MAG: hypothetical protein H8E98_05995 [Bacteroidetes bacterium]|nr:hypothetical protein [Bacteroidota bacterium]